MNEEQEKRSNDALLFILLLVESIKVYQNATAMAFIKELSDSVFKVLGVIKTDTLDTITKGEMTEILQKVAATFDDWFEGFYKHQLDEFKAFSKASMEMSKAATVAAILDLTEMPTTTKANRVLTEIKEDQSLLPIFGMAYILDASKFWSIVKNEALPANGAFIVPFFESLGDVAKLQTINIIRQAWQNNETREQMIELVTDVFGKVEKQTEAVLSTIFNHIQNVANAGVLSSVSKYYQWLSVIDKATTAICRSRNLQVYEFGKGPLPPAHIRCRSSIAPKSTSTSEAKPETFYNWFKDQSTYVQKQYLGKNYDKFVNGEISPAQLVAMESPKPLQISDYLAQLQKFINR